MAIKKYVVSVINLMGGFSQATRPKHVGQLSELIQKYAKDCKDNGIAPSVDGWKSYYNGADEIKEASGKIWNVMQQFKKNLNDLTKEDVDAWTEDLIINKTYKGLFWQEEILRQVSKTDDYRLATPEEESKGIDGVVDGEFVSIKPITYKGGTRRSQIEDIQYRIIYYKELKRGFKII